MLVLTRRTDESIIIDGRIRVTVVKCSTGKVRLAIDAPPDVRIDRFEVHQASLADPRIQAHDIPSPRC